jgi:hypothetical protein
MNKELMKATIVFFDIRRITVTGWIPEGQIITQKYYFEVRTKLQE